MRNLTNYPQVCLMTPTPPPGKILALPREIQVLLTEEIQRHHRELFVYGMAMRIHHGLHIFMYGYIRALCIWLRYDYILFNREIYDIWSYGIHSPLFRHPARPPGARRRAHARYPPVSRRPPAWMQIIRFMFNGSIFRRAFILKSIWPYIWPNLEVYAR